ncbi:unnamed protein product, partial [Effrenium voratum]
MALMEGRMPWTIMPDALRFQPTSATSVRVWQVRINRSGAEVAERLQEVRVLYMAVDCRGEGCCVIFWPELRIQPGLQLEVVLSGLCGARSELNIFHEFMPFRRCEADKALLAEAAQMRQLLQQAQLAQDSRPQLGPPPLQLLSHPGKDIEATSNDLLITLRCPVASLWATLMVRRFDGEFTEVLRACHAVKLRDHIFLVRVKLPLPSHYELKFSVSLPETPREVEAHPFRCPLSGQLLRREGDANANASAPVFVHVPKTAGTSIWEALGPTYSDSGRYPEVPFACMKHNPPQRHVAHSFAIVREPCERLASEFTWGRKLAWFDVYYKKYGVVKEFPPSCQMFNGWVRAVLARFEESSDVEDCHMIPQSCYLSKVDRVLPLDSQLQRNLRLLSPRFARLELK